MSRSHYRRHSGFPCVLIVNSVYICPRPYSPGTSEGLSPNLGNRGVFKDGWTDGCLSVRLPVLVLTRSFLLTSFTLQEDRPSESNSRSSGGG